MNPRVAILCKYDGWALVEHTPEEELASAEFLAGEFALRDIFDHRDVAGNRFTNR